MFVVPGKEVHGNIMDWKVNEEMDKKEDEYVHEQVDEELSVTEPAAA